MDKFIIRKIEKDNNNFLILIGLMSITRFSFVKIAYTQSQYNENLINNQPIKMKSKEQNLSKYLHFLIRQRQIIFLAFD